MACLNSKKINLERQQSRDLRNGNIIGYCLFNKIENEHGALLIKLKGKNLFENCALAIFS